MFCHPGVRRQILEKAVDLLPGARRAQVQDVCICPQRSAGGGKQPFDRSWETREDSEVLPSGEFAKQGSAPRCQAAKIRNPMHF